MGNLKRKKIGKLNIRSLEGVSFFNGKIKHNSIGTIERIFEDEKSGKIEIGVYYHSTGSYLFQDLESCKGYVLATPEEVMTARKQFKEYSE